MRSIITHVNDSFDNCICTLGVLEYGRLRLYPIKIPTLTPDLGNASVGKTLNRVIIVIYKGYCLFASFA